MKFGIKKVLDAVSDGAAVLTSSRSADLSIFHRSSRHHGRRTSIPAGIREAGAGEECAG